MKKIFLSFVGLIFLSLSLFAQKTSVVNQGYIYVKSGSFINTEDYVNSSTSGATPQHGQIILDGTMVLTGDFKNEASAASANVFTDLNTGGLGMENGEVVFAGTGTQHISNNTPNAFINFERIRVKSASETMLDAESAATINGVLNVESGGVFRLASPADGNVPSGSLITNTGAASNVTGAGQLWVDRHFETDGRYQYIGIPVNNATDDLFDNSGNSHPFNANLYSYDETYDAPSNPTSGVYVNWTNPDYAFYNAWTQVAEDGSTVALSGNGVGYITYNEVELDINFGGSPANLNNAASYAPAVSYTPNDGAGNYYDGWNVLANPYPCALDFTQLTMSNVNNCLYLWDGVAGNYKYFNNGGTSYDDGTNILNGASRYIPAMQAFTVKATGNNPTVTINEAARTHNTQAMFKTSKDAANYGSTQFIKLSAASGDFEDETIVRYLNDAGAGFDNEFDAYKMFPNNPPVMIYSIVSEPETAIAINSLPIDDIGVTVPLGFVCAESGTYTIETKDLVFNAGTTVKLVDTYEQRETELYEGAVYEFSAEAGEVRDRFYLFGSITGINNPDEENSLDYMFDSKVWSADDNIFITIKSNEMIDAGVKIFDVTGRLIVDKELHGTYNIINMPGASGTYFVKLSGVKGITQTKKVFIKK